MKKLFALCALASVLTAGCQKAPEKTFTATDEDLSHPFAKERLAFVRKTADLGFHLSSSLTHKQGENILLSPFALSYALSAVGAGAQGQTAAETSAMLDVRTHGSRVASSLAKEVYQSAVQTLNGLVDVTAALFVQKGTPLQPGFLQKIAQMRGMQVAQADFIADAAGSQALLHSWMRASTRHRLQEMFDEREICRETDALLASSCFFKGSWQYVFSQEATTPAAFFLASSNMATVPMMETVAPLWFLEREEVVVVDLPYRDAKGDPSDFSLLLLVPRRIDGLDAVEKQLCFERLQEWRSALQRKWVRLSVPRLHMAWRRALKEPLTCLGYASAFTAEADLSGIDGCHQLKLKQIMQGNWFAVDENGSDPSLKDGKGGQFPAQHPQESPYWLLADHPFLFLVLHRPTGLVLLLGRVVNPKI